MKISIDSLEWGGEIHLKCDVLGVGTSTQQMVHG